VLGSTLVMVAGVILLSNASISVYLKGSLQLLLESVKKIEIMMHMSLMSLAMPGNASIFFSYLFKIFGFDLIPTDGLYDSIFGFEESRPVSLNFELIGYESVYFIRNMGSAFLIIILALIVLLLLAVTSCSQSMTVHKYRTMVKEKLFWNGVLSFIDTTYITGCVSFALNLAVLYDESTPDRHFGTVFCFLVALASGIILFCMPIFVRVYFSRNLDKINECDFEFKQKFGVTF